MNIAKCWTTGRTDNLMSNWVNVKLGLMSNLDYCQLGMQPLDETYADHTKKAEAVSIAIHASALNKLSIMMIA